MNRYLPFCLFSNEKPCTEIAQGIVFSSGKVALSITKDGAVTIFDDLATVAKRYCRDGSTRIVWDYTAFNFNQHNLPTMAELLA